MNHRNKPRRKCRSLKKDYVLITYLPNGIYLLGHCVLEFVPLVSLRISYGYQSLNKYTDEFSVALTEI